HRVDVGAVAADVVAPPVALALEAALLVERERRGVEREHVQLELRDARRARPRLRRLEQRGGDAAAAVRRRDHQAEVGHVRARRMRVAGDRQAPHERSLQLRHDQRAVGMAPEGADVTALLGDGPPARVGEQPAFGLRAHGARERDELLRVARLGTPDVQAHSTTTPAPPRRGSPAAASDPSGLTCTAAAPPKKRLRRRQRTTSYPRRSSRSSSRSAWPPSQCRCGSSRWTRGAAIASSTPSPCPSTFTTICMIAPRSLADPALPTTSAGRPPRPSASVGAIMLVSRRPAGTLRPPTRSYSPSMLFM